ncbi:Uncharacterised protein [Bacteroides faecis]|uniref:Uncharacterized protein n=1 Tax=Bacteroides faecis TaxID=674529 RepID=A0A6N2S1L7_9BACE
MRSKQSVSSSRLKNLCLNLLIRILLYTIGAVLVLIIIICVIPSLFIYLLIGDYSFNKQIDKKYRLSANHFHE